MVDINTGNTFYLLNSLELWGKIPVIPKIPVFHILKRRIRENQYCHFNKIFLNFKKFSLRCLPWGPTPRNHRIKQTVRKLNLWQKTAGNKSVWIKACVIERCQLHYIFVCYLFYFRQTEKDHIGKKNNEKGDQTFFYISNLVANPGLDLGKKLSNLLSNHEALN